LDWLSKALCLAYWQLSTVSLGSTGYQVAPNWSLEPAHLTVLSWTKLSYSHLTISVTPHLRLLRQSFMALPVEGSSADGN
jgi:hypothetical protein